MIYVLTEEINDYNQHGEYYLYAWPRKPTASEVMGRGSIDEETANNIINGGFSGRGPNDDVWWYLREAG